MVSAIISRIKKKTIDCTQTHPSGFALRRKFPSRAREKNFSELTLKYIFSFLLFFGPQWRILWRLQVNNRRFTSFRFFFFRYPNKTLPGGWFTFTFPSIKCWKVSCLSPRSMTSLTQIFWSLYGTFFYFFFCFKKIFSSRNEHKILLCFVPHKFWL